MLTKAFGKVVADLRRKKGVSQEAFAFSVDVHRTYVSQLERGLKNPSLPTICRIAAALGLTASELVRKAESAERRNV